MSADKNAFVAPEPLIDRNPRKGAALRLFLLALVLVAAGVAVVFFKQYLAEPMLLTLLGVFAMIGVFYLFASVIGFIQIAPRSSGDALSKAFLDSQPQGVIVLDRRERIVYANRAYAEITGAQTAADTKSLNALLGGQRDASSSIYRMSRQISDGSLAEQELRLDAQIGQDASQNAKPAWYRVRARTLQTENTLQKYTVWNIANITHERSEQERFFVQVQRAIDHLDRAPGGFIATDGAFKIDYINASIAEWLGLDLAEFQPGKLSLPDLLAGDGMALVRSGANPSAKRNAVFDVDMIKTNGSALPVRFFLSTERDAAGILVSTRIIVLNLIEGDGITDDVRSSEIRFTRFFNSTPMAIASIGRDAQFLRTNAPFVSLFAPKADDDTARSERLEDIVHERDRALLKRCLAAAANGQGDIEPIDTVFPHDEDRYLRIYVNAVAVADGDEDVEEAAIVYAVETTEQKALEAKMAQSQKMQAVGQLAGGIAHDFNNVLNAIILAADLLLTNHRPHDPSFQDIMSIKQYANRAASLVRQLLAFSRRQTLRPQDVSLTDMLADLRMLLTRLVGNDVKLQIEHGRDIWPVRADLGQLEQVVVNLCVNARDAMPDGGSIIIESQNVSGEEIAAYGRKEMPNIDHVLVKVTDTGTGIEPETIRKIFEPFFTTKDVGKGTGLGLSMVYGIIKQSGGFIYAESELGEGTSFLIFLPRHIPDIVVKPIVSGDEEPVALTTNDASKAQPVHDENDLSGSGTVLLVEDEDAVRMGGVRVLKGRGYTVFEASSGVEALEIYHEQNGKIDLVVSDVVMPEMDGPTLLGELRKINPDIKFIFVSGYAEEAFAKNLPKDAQFGFLPKPFSLKQLSMTVKEWIG